MKLKKQLITVAGLAFVGGFFLMSMNANAAGRGCGRGCSNNQQPCTASSPAANLPVEQLSSEERDGLIKMLEEEKLARDTYSVLYKRWGLQIFSNISKSEQQHMSAIKTLLDKYKISHPAVDASQGIFKDQQLQELYTSLTRQGEQSLAEALKVGATIEELDIKDLYDYLEQTDNTDIKTVYQNLAKGSRNHLRSFSAQLSQNKTDFTPQFLTAAQVSEIVNSPRERGRVNADGEQVAGGRGFGRGSGRGRGHGFNKRI
ncbi:MAG: DUF2202 domain-containing protein [Thermodesulfobacteriota bacterium]